MGGSDSTKQPINPTSENSVHNMQISCFENSQVFKPLFLSKLACLGFLNFSLLNTV